MMEVFRLSSFVFLDLDINMTASHVDLNDGFE